MVRRTTTTWLSRVMLCGWFILLGWIPLAQADGPANSGATVQIVRLPADCFVPDVAVDGQGVLHMVYARDRKAYYVRSNDHGASLSEPVQVNSEGTVEYRMGERGPKLALGSDGTIHVVWADFWSPGVTTSDRYTRSRDGGKTFEAAKQVSQGPGDGLTLTVGRQGTVSIFFHTALPPQQEIPQATWLYVARSKDNGATFAAPERVQIDKHTGLACSMCMMRARSAKDGTIFLAFRSAEKNIRDFYVLKGRDNENHFSAERVNRDEWELKSCPMCGPELTLAPDGGLVCAFMARHRVYWSVADGCGEGFRLHVATPANENDEIYPTAVANGRGEMLLVWQVGPMSTTGTATVHWACYTGDGKFTGRQGTIGTTTSGTKATAFAAANGRFFIVTTAALRRSP